MKDDEPPTWHVWTLKRFKWNTQPTLIVVNYGLREWRSNTASIAKRNVSVAWKSFNEGSNCYHSSYHDGLPTLMANVDRPSWVLFILSFRSTDISHLVGEPGRPHACDFACACVLARGFPTGGTAIPMYEFANGKTFYRVLCLNYEYHCVTNIDTMIVEQKTNLMSLAILFHFLYTQHVSDINISIIRSLRLCCWITTSVVLFSVRCVLDIWCG